MQKPVVLIEDWAVVKSGALVAFEDLEPGNILTGKVYGHSRMPDAKRVYTSAILRVDNSNGIVETRNTTYKLGKASANYEESESFKSSHLEQDSTFHAA
jgi:hypothetical protein